MKFHFNLDDLTGGFIIKLNSTKFRLSVTKVDIFILKKYLGALKVKLRIHIRFLLKNYLISYIDLFEIIFEEYIHAVAELTSLTLYNTSPFFYILIF